MTLRYGLQLTLFSLLGLALLGGCASSPTRDLNPDMDIFFDTSYDFSDKKRMVNDLVRKILQAPFAQSPETPLLVIYPFSNETSEQIDPSSVSNDLQLQVLRSGKFRFVIEQQQKTITAEIDTQTKGSVDETIRMLVGHRLRADYLLFGSLRSIKKLQPKQAQTNKSKRLYYSLDITVTDLKTGEIIYTDQAEIAREATKPVIGW